MKLVKSISELSEKEKDDLLIAASELMIDYDSVKKNPKNLENLFKRAIVEKLISLKR